jgi:hypothetical protein
MANKFKGYLLRNTAVGNIPLSFIKADSKTAIERYVNNSDCKMLYIAELEPWAVEYLDKPINELIDGEMIYHDK